MSMHEIKRWDAVICNNNNQAPMLYVIPDRFLMEFFRVNKYSVFCEILYTESECYDNQIISGVVNNSAYTPNCRPNFFADTNMYVITLNMNWNGYPPKNGKVIFHGYKEPKPEIKD